MSGLLLPSEESPVIQVNENGRSAIVLVCEHAGRVIPEVLGDLGLPHSELSRHIAWDIGAEGMARAMSRLLDAPLILQRYSRLAYDCNRPPEHPGAMPEMSETTPIPGNHGLSHEQRMARAEALYFPFHAAVRAAIDKKIEKGVAPVLVTLHSFTRVFKGMERAVELGLLHDADDRLARQLLALTQADSPATDARLNEPYGPQDGVAHTLNLHGNSRGITNVMIEVRNDLIAEAEGQAAWAGQLASRLQRALSGPAAGKT